jgi:hypothetical protein
MLLEPAQKAFRVCQERGPGRRECGHGKVRLHPLDQTKHKEDAAAKAPWDDYQCNGTKHAQQISRVNLSASRFPRTGMVTHRTAKMKD